MLKFSDWKISAQLVATMLGLGLIVAIVIGGWSAWSAYQALKTQIFMHLEAMRDSRAEEIGDWYSRKPREIKTQAERNVVVNTFLELTAFGDAKAVGANDEFPVKDPGYAAIAGKLNTLEDFAKEYNYLDVFLVDVTDGHVMYTSAKKSDLGANLGTGALKDSGLAKCWRQVVDTKAVAMSKWEVYAPSGGEPAQFVGTPMLKNGQMVGVLIVQLSNKRIEEILANETGMGQTGETNLWGEDGLMRNNSRLALKDGKKTMLVQETKSQAFSEGKAGKTGIIMGKNYLGEPVISAYAPIEVFPGHKWVAIASIYQVEAFKPVRVLLWSIIIAIFILAVIVVISAFVTGRRIGTPIGILAAASGAMGKGDFTIELRSSRNKDEIGEMTNSFILMKDSTRTLIQQVSAAATNVASSSQELSAGADETSKAVQQVSITMQEVARGAQDSQRNIDSAQQNLEQTSKAIEGVSRDIEDVAAYATQAAAQGNEGKKSADTAVVIIDHAAISVQQTTQVVISLGEKTKQIGEFISIITGIADQTNLLALNAAIEAARAGDAGRGFAVVAEEVRKLAEESNTAAGNITKLVRSIEEEMHSALGAMEKSNEEVTSGAKTVGEASAMLSEIVKGVEALTERVQGISAAAEEINASTGEILHSMHTVAAAAQQSAAATQEVTSSTEEQTASMEEIGASANALARLSQELQALLSNFKV
jgi:methyl-accepting chemotaxis protein